MPFIAVAVFIELDVPDEAALDEKFSYPICTVLHSRILADDAIPLRFMLKHPLAYWHTWRRKGNVRLLSRPPVLFALVKFR